MYTITTVQKTIILIQRQKVKKRIIAVLVKFGNGKSAETYFQIIKTIFWRKNMSTKLFYFSGTGNSLKLAKDMAQELDNTELLKISYDMNFDQTDCTIAGIVYPVYCFGLPNIVSNFLERVQFADTAYLFGLASYGGMLCSSGHILKSRLKKRGYALGAGFAVQMPGNATNVYDVPKEGKRNGMYQKERKRIPEIAAAVKDRKKCSVETNLGILGRLLSGVSAAMMSKCSGADKSYSTDASCNGCGICLSVCPVGNIELVDNRPVWQHRCECCMACFHWCPQAAIQAGNKTSSRGRYHHPDVHLKEIQKSSAGVIS